jgi:serine/threonine-protein kinase
MPEPEIPEWITRHFVLGPRLGGGTWSDVYQVIDKGTKSPFAVKILKPEFRVSPQLRSRFLTEAKAMARLVHPNIVRIFDVGGALGDEPAIVMEYCEGGDLRQYVMRYGMEAGDAARLALFLLLGLVAAHKAGVIHRGICPESVFLDADMNPKLADFGTALVAQNPHLPTLPAESLGEYLYSAPEQRRNAHDVDVRTDIYGMGALLWFMCRRRDPPDLSLATRTPKLVEQIHPNLAPIIVKACHVRADQRYQSAAEMGRELRALFDQ